jgi:hypothetical protein
MSATGSRLDRWLAPRIEARAADTLRKIDDDPTEVAWFRGNTQIGTLLVKVASAPASQFSTMRGQASQSNQYQVTILAPANTPLKVNDRLTATESRAWVIKGISPDRRAGTEAIAETA